MDKPILYSKAYDANEQIVDINDFTVDNKPDPGLKFKCIGCGNEMITRLGEHNQWHFAHKTLTDSCSSETFLHNYAKVTLYRNINYRLINNEPFYLISGQNVICSPCHLN